MNERLPRSMRAVVYRGANDLRVEELPVPRIGSNELLVKVGVCGVCPTDIKKIHYATVPPPRVFGHETAGTIVKVGARVKGWQIGDRVALHHHVPCLDCHFCRHKAFAQCPTYKKTGITAGFEPAGGGYAEYVRVMSFVLPGVVKVPKGNSLVEGALLEPVNTVLKGVRQLHLLPNDVALVAGQGPIGLMFTRLLTLQGVRVIASDLAPHRLEIARAHGAVAGLIANSPGFPEQVMKMTGKRGLDAAVLAVPSDEALKQAQTLLRGGGELLLFAHTKRGAVTDIDLSNVCVDEKALLGSYSSDVTLQKEVARLVFSRRLDVRALVTHRFPLERTADAVALAAKPTADSLKVVVDVNGETTNSH
ncbi:MAG TPA: alcohol dehydrogenase catalytic domain-containing protein [Methylomirabilota bacterium]|nr:alcohol dehydrogenase catalytic domain-containing protein [Methylomirabilota bacterium]